MTLLRRSEPWAMTAETAAQRRGYAARSELALRNALEAFCRERWPDARICHEMVMGSGKVRADVVAICPDHIAAFEVKGSYDDTTRLLHQVGMYALCVPEVWMVVGAKHCDDADLIRHLMPRIGLLVGQGMDGDSVWSHDGTGSGAVTLEVRAEAQSVAPVPRMTLEMLWADELRQVCADLRVAHNSRTTRPAMIDRLTRNFEIDELLPACCAVLRGRDALWRADPPIRAGASQR